MPYFEDTRTRTITKTGVVEFGATWCGEIGFVTDFFDAKLVNIGYCDYSSAWGSPRVVVSLPSAATTTVYSTWPITGLPHVFSKEWNYLVEYGFVAPSPITNADQYYKTGQQTVTLVVNYERLSDSFSAPVSRTSYTPNEVITVNVDVSGTYEEQQVLVGVFDDGLQLKEYRTSGYQRITIPIDGGTYIYNRDCEINVATAGTANPYSPIPGLSAVALSAYSTGFYGGFHSGWTLEGKTRGITARFTGEYASAPGLSNSTLPHRTSNHSIASWQRVSVEASPVDVRRDVSAKWYGQSKQFVGITANVHNLDGSPYTDPVDLVLTAGGAKSTIPLYDYSVYVPKTTSGGEATSGTIQFWGYTQESNHYETGRPNGIFKDTDVPHPFLLGAVYVSFPTNPSTGISEGVAALARYTPQTWDAMTLSQVARLRRFGNPWADSGFRGVFPASVSIVAGNLRIVSPSNFDERVTASFNTGKIGYRYIIIRYRSVGSARVEATFNNRPVGVVDTWKLTTGDDGEWLEKRIDLLTPETTTRVNPAAPQLWDGLIGGVPLTIDPLFIIPRNKTVEIAWVDGVADNSHVTVRALQRVVMPAIPLLPGDEQLLMGYTDGVLTLDRYTVYQPNPAAAIMTTTRFVEEINKTTKDTGWSAVDLAPKVTVPIANTVNSSYFRKNDKVAWWLHAEGLKETGNGASNVSVYRDVVGAATLSMQPVLSAVNLYPGCGDVMKAGAYGNTTNVRFRQLFGSEAAGIVTNAGDDERVELRLLAPDQDRGSDTPDGTNGFFATNSPFGRGGTGATGYRPGNQSASHVIRLVGGKTPNPQVIKDLFQRQRLHLRFFGTGKKRKTRRNVDTVTHPAWGWFGKAGVLSAGTSLQWQKTEGAYRLASDLQNGGVITATVIEGETITAPSVVIDPAHPAERIITLFQKTDNAGLSNVWESISTDDGATWETPYMAFAGGQMPVTARAIDGSGLVIRSAYLPTDDTTGTIRGTIQNPGDAAPSDEFTFVDETGAPLVVDNEGFTFVQMQEGQSRWTLSCTIAGETEQSDWYSAEDGRTWTRFTG